MDESFWERLELIRKNLAEIEKESPESISEKIREQIKIITEMIG